MYGSEGAAGSRGRRALSVGRRIRSGVLCAAAVVALSSSLTPVRSGDAALARDGESPKVAYRFVSIPDLFNADLGDVRAQPGWDPGDPNSINRSYRRAIDIVFDAIEAEDPLFVAVAGDLVEGHWGEDVDGTGIFGPVGSEPDRLRAITAAGNLYYGEWRDRFARRGLKVYAAVGDHEIGDDLGGRPLDQRWPAGTFKHSSVPTFKAVWARHFTRTQRGHRYPLRPVGTQWEDTAYAVYPATGTLLITLDVFRYDQHGVQPVVSDGQLRWLARLLRRARRQGVENVIVQGHVPVLGPTRYSHSGRLQMMGGAQSRFWRLLKAMKVDIYLSGEVHDVTANEDGVVQISHGGLIAYGGINYMVGTVYENGSLDLEVKRFERTFIDSTRQLWHTSLKRPPLSISYRPRPVTVATARYEPGRGLRRRTGLFRPYRG